MVMESIELKPEQLKEIKLFQEFNETELQGLVQLGTIQDFEPLSNIVIEGELTFGLYLILEGSVGVFKTNKLSGDIYDVGQLRKGQFFGEMSLIDENPRSATVRALSNCSVFSLPKESFFDLLNQVPEMKDRFYSNCVRELVRRLRELDDNYVISQYQLWKSAIKKESA